MKGIKWVTENKIRLFLFLWSLLFVLYWPAWRAGFVSDFTGWLYDLRHSSFADHINRSHFNIKSLYQFTQLLTWFFYQFFGVNHFLWHCLHISLHALNCVLLFSVCANLLEVDERKNAQIPLFAACVLFCISPTLSEVIVWEASFHYLLGFLMLLLNLHCVQLFQKSFDRKWIFISVFIYFLSTFSIEIFYVTPFCILAFGLMQPREVRIKIIVFFVLPLLCLLLLHFVLVKIAFGHWLPHISSSLITEMPWLSWLSKPLKLLFHLLFLGRFYAQDFREKVYIYCEFYLVLIAFYGLLLVVLPVYIWRSKKVKAFKWQFLLILFWTAICIALVMPLWFPSSFWLEYDRYSYFYMGFCFVVLCLLCYKLLLKSLSIFLFMSFVAANVFATYKVNQKWKVTANLTHQLMLNLPTQYDKKVLILNMPNAMNGIYMLPPGPDNEAKLMHNLLYEPHIEGEMIDVCGSNILSATDGVHVRVLNDSTVFVMQNQNGTWWWYNFLGASDREHKYYSLKMVEYGYQLQVKGNVGDYLLLFQSGDQWKQVNWHIIAEDQY